jgi:GDPmannose 4,6-dehydratase
MTSIIFGINGQDGYYLKSILQTYNHNVIGVSRSDGDWVKGNVSNFELVSDLVKTHKPDYIFHLAANSTIQHYALFENHETISTGTINILESVKLHCPSAKVFLSGSAMQFKNEGHPISEQTDFEPGSPYAIARIQSVLAGRYYRGLGLKVYVGYFFHHDSPFRNEKHLDMKIVKTVLKIKSGIETVLEIGNPNVIKEFNHAYDMMTAVWCLVNQDAVFEAIIGCGTGYSINNWIDICFKIAGIDKKDHLKIKPGYSPDFFSIISNPQTIKSLGWKPVFDIEYLANDMFNNE